MLKSMSIQRKYGERTIKFDFVRSCITFRAQSQECVLVVVECEGVLNVKEG